jgi:hypothetical protein
MWGETAGETGGGNGSVGPRGDSLTPARIWRVKGREGEFLVAKQEQRQAIKARASGRAEGANAPFLLWRLKPAPTWSRGKSKGGSRGRSKGGSKGEGTNSSWTLRCVRLRRTPVGKTPQFKSKNNSKGKSNRKSSSRSLRCVRLRRTPVGMTPQFKSKNNRSPRISVADICPRRIYDGALIDFCCEVPSTSLSAY